MPLPNFELNPSHLMRDVYSYPFPEVRELVNSFNLPQEFMLNTLPALDAAEHLASYDFQPPLELPVSPDGTLRLDDLHEPVIDRIRNRVGAAIHGLDSYSNTYPVPGSNQAIFNLLAEWHAIGKISSVAVLEGEYDGYAANAETLRIPVHTYPSLDIKPENGQLWFVSNPNARDGNWLENDQWKSFIEAGHQIVYDAAYVGLTKYKRIDASSENIQAVLTSPSKIFGVFRNRYTGITYTREPIKSMYSTKWFKSIPGLLDTLKLYETFGANELPDRYHDTQEALCHQLGKIIGNQVMPSDILLLGHTDGHTQISDEFDAFRRANGYRFGLTKLFEDVEHNGPTT